MRLVRLSLNLMVSHNNHFVNYSSSTSFSSLGSTGGQCDFSSAQAGRRPISRQSLGLYLALNWPGLREEYAHPLGAGLSFPEPGLSSHGARRYHRLLFVSIFRLCLFTSYWLLSKDLRLVSNFRFSIFFSRNRDSSSDNHSLAHLHNRLEWQVCLNSLVWSHSRLGFHKRPLYNFSLRF